MNLLRKLFVILLLSVSFAAFAQDDGDPCVQSFGKQIDKTFAKARDFHKSGKKAEANALYNEILDEYPEHLEAASITLRASCFRSMTKSLSLMGK